MAVINYQKVGHLGSAVPFVAAGAGGDDILPNARGVVLIRNGDTTATTVTVDVPGTTYGVARPDYTLSVAAGATAALSGLPADIRDTDGFVSFTYSKVTSLTVAAIEI